MKKVFSLLLAAFLLSAVFCAAFLAPLTASADPADVRYEVFDLTAVDAGKDWYQDGIVVAIPNSSDKELSIASGDYQLRYVFILVFNKDGVCVEVGNNLLSADDEKAAEFPQHDVKIPAGGFTVLFYYNANEGPSNAALYEYYDQLGGTAYTNETGRASSGKNYMAVIENNTVTVYFGAAADTPDEPSSEAPSEESPSEDSSAATSPEESSDPTSEETSAPAAATSSATSSEDASAVSSASDATSSQSEDGESNIGIIIGIVAAVVVVVGVVAVVIVRKKKN